MKKKKMKINGLFVFSLVLGTFSLSLNRIKREANLTGNAVTLPSVDTAISNTDTYTDSDLSRYNIETTIQTTNVREVNNKQHFFHLHPDSVNAKFDKNDSQENYNSNDGLENTKLTTSSPQSYSSYLVQFITRRNAECNPEVDNENSDFKDQNWTDLYCTEKIEEHISNSESIKANESESEPTTVTTINDINEHEEIIDIPQYKRTQERNADTKIESGGQDIDFPTRFHLDSESMLLNKSIIKRESSLYQNIVNEDKSSTYSKETQTTVLSLDVDYINQHLVEYSNDQSSDNIESSNYAVRFLYGLSYLYSILHGRTSNVTKMVTGIFN